MSAVQRIGVIEGYPSMEDRAPACPAWHDRERMDGAFVLSARFRLQIVLVARDRS